MSLNICKQLSKFDIETLSFNNTIKNKIIKNDDSLFTSINLNINSVVINNACLLFSIKDPDLIQYNVYKNSNIRYKCYFDENKNKTTYNMLENLEKLIINKYCNIYNKKQIEKVYSFNHIENGKHYIKYYINTKSTNSIINRYCFGESCLKNKKTEHNNKLFVIKISGIWETENKVGVSYKICAI